MQVSTLVLVKGKYPFNGKVPISYLILGERHQSEGNLTQDISTIKTKVLEKMATRGMLNIEEEPGLMSPRMSSSMEDLACARLHFPKVKIMGANLACDMAGVSGHTLI